MLSVVFRFTKKKKNNDYDDIDTNIFLMSILEFINLQLLSSQVLQVFFLLDRYY